MNLQDFVKYLLCVLSVHVTLALNNNSASLIQKPRTSRGFLDSIVSRFRTCGGCLCGRSNRMGSRFFGGETTQSHEFPWLTNIHVKSDPPVSGTLINDRYVLTSASQLVGATAPEIKVTIGAFDRCNIDISSSNVSVEHIIMYPEFIKETNAHDLALLRLTRPINFEKRVTSVCLPNPGSTYLGQVGTVLGWTASTDDDSNSKSCLPKKMGLPILGTAECLKSGVELKNYHADSGCIGVFGTKSLICQSDVGTSVLYRSYLGIYDIVGLLSNGNSCDENSTQAAVYTRIGPHLDWILQNTKDACYCTK
ncbi:phenoloxidase-activating factor 3-like [Aphidius gifuensis]|uniref:phenoloxidase-activating factor 3-like n=1 Tax=Aphidius gifuensis TaxID=684658 RepID=UPI001CDB864E|nr:phenoloxidase-activating factor 3-like [Aphidius gifuensis]